MPKGLTAASGIDALTHAIEAYVSALASEYTNGLALEAARLIFKYLPQAYLAWLLQMLFLEYAIPWRISLGPYTTSLTV